jgi:rhodanese-related sulfurtransferase
VVKNKAVPLVLVCASGARSKRAVAIARKLGYDNVQVAGRRPQKLARSQSAD